MGLEDLAVDDDAGVTQDAMLPLLVELPQELPVVGRDLHVLLPVVHLGSCPLASPPHSLKETGERAGS